MSRLFDDTSTLGIILHHLGELTTLANHSDLSMEEVLGYEDQCGRLAGNHLQHPATRSPLVPFLKNYFAELKAWLPDKRSEAPFLRLCSVVRGEKADQYRAEYEAGKGANPAPAPAWYSRLVELLDLLLRKPDDAAVSREKLGVLLRNIPGDTTFGLLGQACLREYFSAPDHLDQVHEWWLCLKGDKAFGCEVKVQGLYVWVKF